MALYALARTVRLLLLSLFFLPQLAFGRQRAPAVLRRYLQTCGGGFVKLGQVLASRYDLLPEAYCDELARLLDRVPPAPAAAIEQVVADDLGRPLTECFDGFDPTPLGSASIAQVHPARLISGEAVAVKVIRPGIARTFRIDLAYLAAAGRFSSRFGVLTHLRLEAMARELSRLTREELDFRREARNAAFFNRRMAEDEIDHCAPRVYFDLCGPRVITMERIQGVPMTELLAAVQHDDQARLEEWAARGIRPRRTARLLLRSVLQQTMQYRVFNADPHPANLILKAGGALAWLDFGMVGWLDEQTWGQQFRLQAAVANGHVQSALETLLASLAPLPARDLTVFELEAKGIIRDWVAASGDPRATVYEKSTARFFLRLFAAIQRAGLSLPAELLRVYRTVVGADSILLRLDPSIDWLPELRDIVAQEAGRQVVRAMRPDLAGAAQAWLRFFSSAFNLVNWLDVRLPQMARSYQQEFSQLERVARLALRYGRALVLIFLALVLIAHIPPLRVDSLAALDARTGPHLVVISLACLGAVVLLSRLIGELRPR